MNNNENRLVIHDNPTSLWFFGVIAAGIGAFMYFGEHSPWWTLLGGLGLGVFIVALSSVLTITVDKSTGFLTLEYRSLLRHSKKEIALHELEAIQVDQHVTSDSEGTSTTYQIVAVTSDGMVTPFRSYYSGGWRGKQKIVDRLRAFTGVGGADPGLKGMFTQASQLAKAEFKKQQASLSGPQDDEHVTDGVRWQVQTAAFGGTPVTRWFSPTYKTNGNFLYLAQIVKGQKTPAGGLMASLNKTMLKASMAIYGLEESEVPDLDRATPLDLKSIDARLTENFSAFTDSPAMARQILTPWASMPLAGWASKHPLKQIRTGYGSQLVVLFSTNGTYLGTFGAATPQQLDELTALGVELVRAQGTPTA